MSTYGADWTPDQNRIIVEAYFSMLRKQQDGEPYVKAQINREVVAQTGKTRPSQEWKLCNISYLLEEMEHPIVSGYKPRRNAQRGSLYQEISRRLEVIQYPPMFVAIEQDMESSGAFDFASLEDARDRTYQNIVMRRGQSAFRNELLEAYQGSCAFTGYDSEFALEACHIIP